MKLPILMYHNINTPPAKERLSSLYTSPQTFHRQMSALAFLGYKGVSLRELLPYLKGEKQGKVVGITFDDGYLDNLENALPILNKYNFSSTCYLVPGQIGKSNVWCAGQNVKECSLMNQSHIQEWLKHGQDIGSHTVQHVHLCQIEKKKAQDEITDSKKLLEDAIGVSILDFCYPYGEYNEGIKNYVKEAGYLTATTTERKRFELTDSLFSIPRVHMNRRTSLPLFLAKLFTSYEDSRFKKANFS
jgi:peptidoglycan/xylan/chitin deacetylase (PgdA/CDA1 family)